MQTVIVLDEHCTDLLCTQMVMIENYVSALVSEDVPQLRSLAELLKTELQTIQKMQLELPAECVMEIRITEQLLK